MGGSSMAARAGFDHRHCRNRHSFAVGNSWIESLSSPFPIPDFDNTFGTPNEKALEATSRALLAFETHTLNHTLSRLAPALTGRHK